MVDQVPDFVVLTTYVFAVFLNQLSVPAYHRKSQAISSEYISELRRNAQDSPRQDRSLPS